MSFQLTIPFTDESNYIFDSDKVQVIGGVAKLKLQDNPGQDFIQNFDNDTGFTYDSDLAEFVSGKVQQKVQKPNNSLLYAKWTSDEDADYAVSDVTGTLEGSASISAGKLSCVGEVTAYLDFSNISQGDGNAGTAKFKWTPKYSGAPATEKHIFYNGGAVTYTGAIWLIHSGTNLYFYIYNSVAATVLSKTIAFSPVADTTYEIAITWDYTGANDSNVFIDGDLKDGGNVNDTRGDTLIHRLGSDLTSSRLSDHEYDDFVIYDSVIYTESYTPGYTLPVYVYATSNIILPEMEYTGPGALVTFDSFTTTESGSPRYTLQIGRSGDYLYWDGAAWSISDGTYSQANDVATFNSNLGDLDVEDEIYGQFKINFTNSNTQSYVDTLTASLTAQIYPTDSPTIEVASYINHEGLSGFTETSTKSGNDEIKYILKKGASWYYHNGSDWATSDGTYSQSNTAAEIYLNLSTFTTVGIQTYIKAFLYSYNGSTTPELDQLVIDYDFFGGEISAPSICVVFGYIYDEENNPISGVEINVSLQNKKVVYNNEVLICNDTQITTTDSSGYWEIELINSANMDDGSKYIFTFTYNNHSRTYIKNVPDEASKNFGDLT